jgi:CheY-like chemotaxis protein
VDFDLHSVVTQLSRLYALRISEKSLNYSLTVDPLVPKWVNGDPTRLRQILDNFLSNALKFTPAGSIALRVRSESGNGHVRFEVSDSGLGISEEVQKQLFAAFTQADASTTREFGGTGLGLAISKQLAELMGGRIGLESTVGKGSTFWISIPMYPAMPQVEQDVQDSKNLSRETVNPQRILLAEDNSTNQMVAIGLLHKLGYRDITVAGDGREVLAQCAESRFDLILMDCQMPIMDGYEATRVLRSQGYTLPIIAMTANAVSGDRDVCLAAGMDDYLSKPVSRELLGATLSRWTRQPAGASEKGPAPVAAAIPAASVAPPSPSVPPLTEVFDHAGILDNLDGDRDLFDSLLELALEDFPKSIESLSVAWQERNAEAFIRQAHSIKGAASNVGAVALSEQASRFEQLAKTSGLEAVADGATRIAQEFARFKDAVARFRG